MPASVLFPIICICNILYKSKLCHLVPIQTMAIWIATEKSFFLILTSFFILGTKLLQNVIFQNKTIFALKEKHLNP